MICPRPVKCIFFIYLSALFLSVTHALLSADQPKFQRGNRSLFPKLNEEHQLTYPVVSISSPMSDSSSQDLICRFDQALAVGHKLCVIARGLPGRGKTTLVQEIVTHYDSCGEFTAIMVAADDYMIDSSGEYFWEQTKLDYAHTQCREKLKLAIEHGVDVVCQHNTNVCRWESAELQVMAEASGYIVVFIEPKYAWSRRANLPENVRNVLVNSHGVPEEQILKMGSRKEMITPQYLAYFIRSSRLMESFTAAGVTEKVFLEALQRLYSSEDKSRTAKGVNKTYIEAPAKGMIADVKQTVATEQLLNDFLPKMVHITTDYIGFDPNILSQRNHEEMLSNALTSCTLQVVALFADERGIGAYVTSPIDDIAQTADNRESESKSESEHDGMTEIEWIDKYIKQHHNVPRYSLYTNAEPTWARLTDKKLKLPHITVKVNAPHSAKELGFAASDFHHLLLNGCKILTQGESEVDVSLEGPLKSSSIFFPSVVNVGNFSALLFEHPVRFDSTYAYFYEDNKLPKESTKKARNKNYTSPTGPRKPKPQNRRTTY